MAGRSRTPLLLLAAALVGIAGCSGGGSDSAGPTTVPVPPTEPAPETTAPATTGTTGPTTTTTTGPPRTTTTFPVDLSGGTARISGSVVGPQGPVANATVRVERLVEAQVATLDVGAPGGQFNVPSVRGGHYRLRAWRAPDFIQQEPEVFFLAADEVKTLDLRVNQVGQVNFVTTVDPSPPPAQDPFSIVVQVYAGSVTADGTLQGISRNGVPVQIVLGPGLGLQGPDRVLSDEAGRAVFRVRCLQPGNVGADAVVDNVRLPLSLPACPSG